MSPRVRLPSSERLLLQDYPVLYVDDEAPNLDIFEAVFGDDFVVHVASSGAEALALLDVEPISVVVADNRMPNMSGIELFRAIGERFPMVKRVLCTAYSDQRTAIEAINLAGVQHYLVKPWDATEVEQLLRSLVATAHMERSAHTLKANLIERERSAALDGIRGRITHGLGNMVTVLRAADEDLQQTLVDHRAQLAGPLLEDLEDQAAMIRQASQGLAKLHKDSRAAQLSTGELAHEEHAVTAVVDGVSRMVWHDLLGTARLDFAAEPDLFVWSEVVALSRILVAGISWASSRVQALHIQPPVIQLRVSAGADVVHFDVVYAATDDADHLNALLAEGLEALVSGEDRKCVLTLAVARDLALALEGTVDALVVTEGTRLRVTVPRSV